MTSSAAVWEPFSKAERTVKCPSVLKTENCPAEMGVNLKQGYNGDLTSREAGSVGGQMVKKMIESYEKGL